MEDLSDAPNALVKVSGLGQRGLPWTVEANGPLVRDTIAIFGPERVMFASNFPVDGLCASPGRDPLGFKTIAAGYRPADQRAMFCDNARRVYGTRGRPSGR